MEKRVFKIRLFGWILGLVEIALLSCFTVFYILNLWNIQKYVTVEYVIYGALFFILFSCLFSYFSISSVLKIRKDGDLTSIKVFGNDIKEAHMFGKLGFVVTDQDGVVLWQSNLLLERQINIIDTNIYEWCPKLKDFVVRDANAEITIEQNKVFYSVKYLKTAGLFVFKDITEYEILSTFSQDSATCLGIISIDNYNDVNASVGDDYSDLMANVKIHIMEYAKKYGVLIRSFKADAYFAVCNFKSLQMLKADKFSILNEVKEIGNGTTFIPTLSIGFAHGFPDVSKLNNQASLALEIAISRGGDQAVVSKFSGETEFYGGKSEAMEKRNKVKVKYIANDLVRLINEASNVIIMGHKEMDMDALGSCLGVKAICDSLSKPAQVVYDEKSTERKTNHVLRTQFSKEELKEITISPKDAKEKISPKTLVIICDFNSLAQCPDTEIISLATKVGMIDHHRRGAEIIENPVFDYIDSSSSSASELIAEFLKYNDVSHLIKIPPIFATIMLSGIFLDTMFFKAKTVGMRTFEASMILKSFGADNSLADDFLKDDYEEYALINNILSTLKFPYSGIAYCISSDDDIIDTSVLAKVSNLCLTLKGINACFTIGRTIKDKKEGISISARSDGSVNVQILMEKLQGGGHFTSAGGSYTNGENVKFVENKLLEVLETHLTEARVSIDKKK